MGNIVYRRLAVVAAIAVGLSPLLVVAGGGGKDHRRIEGKVVPLADELKEFGAVLDPAASPYWLALVTANGETYPLIYDRGSKMFFTDKSVVGRPMQITGRLFGKTHLLQVLDVKSLKDGKLHDIYYWCDICAIRRNAGGVCECCGGPMELKEEPLER